MMPKSFRAIRARGRRVWYSLLVVSGSKSPQSLLRLVPNVWRRVETSVYFAAHSLLRRSCSAGSSATPATAEVAIVEAEEPDSRADFPPPLLLQNLLRDRPFSRIGSSASPPPRRPRDRKSRAEDDDEAEQCLLLNRRWDAATGGGAAAKQAGVAARGRGAISAATDADWDDVAATVTNSARATVLQVRAAPPPLLGAVASVILLTRWPIFRLLLPVSSCPTRRRRRWRSKTTGHQRDM
mmetsp:Transcript_5644/g.11788  ORF Transcript_5644/g.11788 Transcript_5644/m.11788 type:complete len:239 (-) Transcript_5644:99-815(-)